jgi:hypothetical protein
MVDHVGLGQPYIEQAAGSIVALWTTSKRDKRSARRLDLVNQTGGRTIRLFGDDFNPRVSSSPTISFDGTWVIAQGRRLGNDSTVTIRVWRFTDLVRTGNDAHSIKPLYEWDVDIGTSKDPVQSLASDGKTIWIIAGSGNNDADKHLFVYSLDGQAILKDRDFELGKHTAVENYGEKSSYEPEALAFYLDPSTRKISLALAFNVGPLRKRNTLVFTLDPEDYVSSHAGLLSTPQ